MALTIRMRIDENDEHSYYYATGSGTEIELIPLVVDENGVFVPDEGKAYNRVTVNVPETELETLIVDANGTYNAPDGKAYDVVTVNVQQIINLQDKSATYTLNGNYTIESDSGYDGLGTVYVAVDVPEPVMPVIEPSKQETIEENGVFTIIPSVGYDAMEEVTVEVDVPSSGGGNIETGSFQFDTAGATQKKYINANSISNIRAIIFTVDDKTALDATSLTNAFRAACVCKDGNTNYWFKFETRRSQSSGSTLIGAGNYSVMSSTAVGNSISNAIGLGVDGTGVFMALAIRGTATSPTEGFAAGFKYNYMIIYDS